MSRPASVLTALSSILALTGCPNQGIQAINASPEADIVSHSDGEEVLEGTSVAFWGVASDPDHQPEELTATWYLDGTEVCPATPANPDGMTACEAVIGPNDDALVLEVKDPKGAAGSATVALVVVPSETPVASITAPEATGIYYSDQLIVFEGEVGDAEDAASALTAWWSSSLVGDLDVQAEPSSAGDVLGSGYLTEGEHAITLHAQDSSDKTGTDSVIVDVGPPNSAPSCTIVAPETGGVGEDGALVTFEALVSDVDIAADWLEVTWTSDKDGELGLSTPSSAGEVVFSWSDLSVDTHTVSITVADEVGATCTDFVVYSVGTAPEVSLGSPTGGSVHNEGASITFSAEVSDNEDGPTDLALSWDSDLDGPLSTQGADSSGLAQFSLTTLSTGEHSLTLTVTDSDGLFSTAMVGFTVNALPTAPSVTISPDPATTADDLTATASGSTDPDGSGTVSYSYTWYEDGALSSASTSSVFPASATSKDRSYRVVVTPSDGTGDGEPGGAEITIGNASPAVTSVSITPDPAFAADTLSCSYSGFSDPDGDTDASTYAWTVNGVVAGTGSTLASGFVGTDTVTCTVTPFDGTDTGSPVPDSLVISNTPPELYDVSLTPSLAYEGDSLTCTPGTSSDDDGDTISYAYAWMVEGVDPGETTPTLSSTRFDRDETVYCMVTPSDSTDDGVVVTSNSVTISNSAPSVASVSISPSSPSASDTLTCSYSGYSDADGDPDVSTREWTVNGVAVGNGVTLSGFFWSGDEVVCTVTPYDGTDAGVEVSASVTVQNQPPVVLSVTLSPGSVYTDDTITASVSTDDADGDSVTVAYAWYVDGSLVGETSTSLDGSIYFSKDQTVYVVVTPNDGTEDGPAVASSSTTVLNTAPGAPSVSIDPEDPVEGEDDLVCIADVESTDDDGDSVSYGFAWTVDGATWGGSTSTTYRTGDTIAAAETTANDVWGCVVTPNDGRADGPAESASIVVLTGFVGGDTDLSLSGAKLIGENAYDGAALSVSSAGDVNADGNDDLLVGAWKENGGGEDSGSAYLVLGPVHGQIDLATADAKLVGEGSYENAGWSVSSAGDTNGDGFHDVFVGATDNGAGGSQSGAGYIVLGPILGEVDLSTADGKLVGETGGDRAGWCVSDAGDVDADGFDDLLIGAPFAGSTDAGAAYLVLGPASGSVDLSGSDARLAGEADYDYAGCSVSAAGDVNADGLEDALVGAYGESTGGEQAGAAYLLLGPVVGTTTLSTADAKLIGEARHDQAAVVASAGDVDGDGYTDILVGANGEGSGGEQAGAAYLLLGPVTGTRDLSTADAKIVGEAINQYVGTSIASAGDVDADGQDDILLGAYGDGEGGSQAGAAYLMLGPVSGEVSISTADTKLIGEVAGDSAGRCVSSAGDVDADGRPDLLVGALYENSGGTDSGAAYLLYVVDL